MKTRYTLEDCYKEYNEHTPIDKKVFKEVCKVFNHFLMKSLIETGDLYKLPLLTGVFSVRKRKTGNRKSIDYQHWKKTGELLYLNNKHSDGYYARFNWSKEKPQCRLTNKRLIKFLPSRYHKRYLANAIKTRNIINKYYDND